MTTVQERSVPKPVFTDAEAGAAALRRALTIGEAAPAPSSPILRRLEL